MEAFLNFLIALTQFTVGLFVLAGWIIAFGVVAIEVWDLIFERKKTDDKSEEDA